MPSFNNKLPIVETLVPTSILGDVIVTTNDDLIFDSEEVIGALFDDSGFLRQTDRVGGRVRQVPGHDLVFREQSLRGGVEALQEAVRYDADEINILRMLGISVVSHATMVMSASKNLNAIYAQKPIALTIAEKLTDEEAYFTFDPFLAVNASITAEIIHAFQAYYTHEPGRPHKSDIAVAKQFSKRGVLMDVDMYTTGHSDSTFDNCGFELRRMYASFGSGIEYLTKDVHAQAKTGIILR